MNEDIANFLILCSARDRLFLDIPDSERKTEDYARLMYISARFGFWCIFNRLIDEAQQQKRYDEILDYVKNLKGDFTIKNKWMTDFIDNIEFPDFKQAAIDFWEQENKK